jgi:hypothetical protein
MRLAETGIALHVSDVSSQKMANVRDIPEDSTVGELVRGLLAELDLPQNDVEGRPLTYGVRRQRDGQYLHAAERIGEALRTGDSIMLQPSIDAG